MTLFQTTRPWYAPHPPLLRARSLTCYNAQFCFPTGIQLRQAHAPPPATHHSFVITDVNGGRSYGVVVVVYEPLDAALEKEVWDDDNKWELGEVVRLAFFFFTPLFRSFRLAYPAAARRACRTGQPVEGQAERGASTRRVVVGRAEAPVARYRRLYQAAVELQRVARHDQGASDAMPPSNFSR